MHGKAILLSIEGVLVPPARMHAPSLSIPPNLPLAHLLVMRAIPMHEDRTKAHMCVCS